MILSPEILRGEISPLLRFDWRAGLSTRAVGADGLRVAVEQREQWIAQEWSAGEEARDQRIFLVAAQRRDVEFERPASGAFDQVSTYCHVLFVFPGEREGEVGAAGSHQCRFVGDRVHRANVEFRGFEWFPLAAFHFAAAGKDERAVKIFALAGLGGLAVVGHAGVARSEDE